MGKEWKKEKGDDEEEEKVVKEGRGEEGVKWYKFDLREEYWRSIWKMSEKEKEKRINA